MSFDGIVTRAVVHELKESMVSGRIVKIRQPYPTDLFITIRANRKNRQLLLSANPSFARMHLTNTSIQNPPEPPMFCMLLRKHIDGGFIKDIEQKNMERVVVLTIESRDEIGDPSTKKLIIELMGKHSNIILVEEKNGLILDAMKHLPPSVNRHRTVLPGRPYVEPPAQYKLDPLTADKDTVLKKLDLNQGKLDRQLVDHFSGLSPLVAKEILHRAGIGHANLFADTFTSVMNDIKHHQYSPEMTLGERSESFSVISLTHKEGKKTRFDSPSEMLERFYAGKAERDRVKQQAQDLERLLRNELQKDKKKIKKLENTLKKAEKDQVYQKYGELLTANLHQLKGGEKEIEVIDYYDEEGSTITLPLDPEKSPSANAQHFFKKYNKAKNSMEAVYDQIEKTEENVDYIERVLQQLETASPSDIEDIREELAEEGLVKKKPHKKGRKQKPTKPKPEVYHSSDGIDILVGKNNKQNEYVTNRLAHPNDTWLHTKDIPGSHVVIRASNPPEQTLHEAANLAAYFSKGRQSGSVPVDYTKIRHVRKPNGARPGYVIYDEQTTLFVTPDEELVYQLKTENRA